LGVGSETQHGMRARTWNDQFNLTISDPEANLVGRARELRKVYRCTTIGPRIIKTTTVQLQNVIREYTRKPEREKKLAIDAKTCFSAHTRPRSLAYHSMTRTSGRILKGCVKMHGLGHFGK